VPFTVSGNIKWPYKRCLRLNGIRFLGQPKSNNNNMRSRHIVALYFISYLLCKYLYYTWWEMGNSVNWFRFHTSCVESSGFSLNRKS